jgi:hypothetical protein
MRKAFFIKLLFLFILIVFPGRYFAGAQVGKNSLNKELEFYGDHLVYKGKNIMLGPHAFYIDGQCSTEMTSKYPYVF